MFSLPQRYNSTPAGPYKIPVSITARKNMRIGSSLPRYHPLRAGVFQRSTCFMRAWFEFPKLPGSHPS